MANIQNEEMVTRYFNALNRKDPEIAVADIADDFMCVIVPTGDVYEGKKGFREFLNSRASTFTGEELADVLNLVAGEGWAVAEYIRQGVHSGTFGSPIGDIAPTKRPVEFPVCEIFEIRNDKISATHLYFDMFTVLGQLGMAVELPKAA